MAKDWESFKEEMIEFRIYDTHEFLKNVEVKISSPIERIAYVALYIVFESSLKNGKAFLATQERIGPYKADIYFERSDENGTIHKFVIECDGHEWHEKTKQQAAHDKKRDRFMLTKGFKVLRYTGSEIVTDSQVIPNDILIALGLKKAIN